CLHVCMFACLHVCMFACLHVCMFACLHVCMYIIWPDPLQSIPPLMPPCSSPCPCPCLCPCPCPCLCLCPCSCPRLQPTPKTPTTPIPHSQADSVGTETLKNLVLPGVGSFTILDDFTVDHQVTIPCLCNSLPHLAY
ncbi:hypothetical protein B484DRAFT_342072, partial [Ochromonadaceae sp. CCMP2298]